MNDTPAEGGLSQSNLGPDETRLDCIGSFKAHTEEGEAYTIEIWTHFGAVHNRDRQRVAPTELILTTANGERVNRIGRGEYRLQSSPEIELSSDDPNAP